MVRSGVKRGKLTVALTCAWLSWGCPAARGTDPRHAGDLHVFAEGPCSELSIHAVGERRFVTYGDTGYDLQGWLPGDRLPAAQALVEIAGGRAFMNPAFSAGIPTDARGYARGSLALGGDPHRGVWLLLTTTRYARGGTGALFERETEGFSFAGDGWQPSAEPVALPPRARDLPALPGDACGELVFIPLAWEATASGGIVVGGRCDDERAQNPGEPIVVVMHGAAGARSWRVERLDETDALDGIVNLELAARGDDDVYLVAYEPFRPREARQSLIAHFDGQRWRSLDWPIDGAMSIALASDGSAHVAASRSLHRRHGEGRIETVKMPPLSFADVAEGELHIHTVRSFDDELWVEASYRVNVPAAGGRKRTVWASALYSRVKPPAPYYCDAREPAEAAFYEVSP